MRTLSPAQRHRHRILQEKAQAATPYGAELTGSGYDLMRTALARHKNLLTQIQSHERRAEIKAQFLPDYLDWIDTAIAKGNGAQDQVLTTVMVWCFDAGAYALGLRIAAYVIANNMAMADDYKRSPAAIVIDEISNAYLKGQWSPLTIGTDANGNKALLPLDEADAFAKRTDTVFTLGQAYDITREQDAPDQARAKLHKAIAYAMLGKVQTADEPDLSAIAKLTLQAALSRLTRALELDSNAGVKKDIERIERTLAKATTSAAETANTPATETATPSPATSEPEADHKRGRPSKAAAAATKTAAKPAARKAATKAAPARKK
ncbi:MAG: hypothetical protein GAK30_01590 [Paracidovorax wautersii]|uniref:Phage small terminase subunit n=1 Tax=Paracidovorax wautersii TaxID=1177982 RepID=A0A7V8FPS3_9BURK|nr:MAG: hypothetical protein GAK30_01590 [Paracidovorax wautersii]